MTRTAKIHRKTAETHISIQVDLDGRGESSVQTGMPFFDHMLAQLAKHGLFDLMVEAQGDLEVDYHHTVEDVGITLGEAFEKALGEKVGIQRYGSALVPLDEALVSVAVDLSGRPYLVYQAPQLSGTIGSFHTELVKEFFRAFATHVKANLHITVQYGENRHHIVEAMFKGVARALDQATAIDPRRSGIPSTKGKL
ncbi:MAG: imidazoleglycerol-phosphate dehydratase HisB [candidate division NC10 bacterium]|nr:imidazoleglycerol-phosphate dehydratase HisB [candidate division NC10 bacterium]